jgi:hypothetical protein
MGRCAGAIGVDSGLSHIAVALDLPHVQIYNFDTAWRTGPVGRRASAASTPADASGRRGLARLARGAGRCRMIRPLYSLVLIGAQPLLRRKLRRRAACGAGYLEHVEERFGQYDGATEPGGCGSTPCRWARRAAAAILIEALRSAGRRCASCSRTAPRPGAPRASAAARRRCAGLAAVGHAQAVTALPDHFRPAPAC